jgi:glc operon protein GlcG
MKTRLFCIAVTFSGLFAGFTQAAPLTTKPVITLSAAKLAIACAGQDSQQRKAPFVISVVDDGGHLIYLERTDGVPSAMVEASIMKAQTAAGYGVTTKAVEQQIIEGHPGFANLPGSLPMEGGVPVMINGQLAGAIGVAGGLSPDDGAFAQKAAAALSSAN